jgi:hypothetical protein
MLVKAGEENAGLIGYWATGLGVVFKIESS